jgi:hypothetical protein
VKKLQLLLNGQTITITGLLRSTPLVSIQPEACLPRAKDLLNHRQIRYATRAFDADGHYPTHRAKTLSALMVSKRPDTSSYTLGSSSYQLWSSCCSSASSSNARPCRCLQSCLLSCWQSRRSFVRCSTRWYRKEHQY